VAGSGAGAGSSIRAETGGGSFSFAASSRVLPSVALESILASSFFSFSFFLDLTPALLKATSNCLDDTPRTGRFLLGAADCWPEWDGPGVDVAADVLPCVGGSDGWGSGLGRGGCFWGSCFCDCLRGSLTGLGGGFTFGMTVGTGVDALAGALFGVWGVAPLACFWAAFFTFLLDSGGGVGFATSFFLASRLEGGIALLITDWSL